MVNLDGDRCVDVGALQRMVSDVSLGGVSLAGNERLLDIGCGDGSVTLQLATRLSSGSAVGVDISSGEIDKALARASGDAPAVQFRVADALDLPFDSEFDIAVAFSLLEWIEDKRAALGQMARSLDTGGRVYVQMAVPTDRPNLEAVTVDVARRWRYRETFYDFETPYFQVQPREFIDLTAPVGFVVSKVEVNDLEWQFDSDSDFRQWFQRSMSMWIELLKEGMVDDFVDEVMARYRLVVGEPRLLKFRHLGAWLTLSDR